ncbi:GNAT family N-acetyltransferase [Pelagicoccus mobilis]|uniref:GNAT family N-acetyltransferase n=1 Tax=Pelagicoccus mobilis TaxID=415221 RepID=A0A934S0S6_9BACT|nr:GNAT family N-acetyltransferase [Pelagicoccus mobilis]MBK1879090.1 GNAT family N-acetyltransferase [Pelagicoccus mobilis]
MEKSESMQALEPLLEMLREGFEGLPEIELPDRFRLRRFREGDEAAWCRVIGQAFGGQRTIEYFEENMVQYAGARLERIYFIEDENEVVCATAAAYGDDEIGYVHYVGLADGYEGKRLGYWVCLAVLHDFRDRGCSACYLKTDDFRTPALKTYARLGFKPKVVHENQIARWRKVAETIDCPDLVDTIEDR